MKVKLPKKFADKELDKVIDSIYFNHKLNQNDEYHFDLTDVEYIGNQELLVLSAIFKSFYESGIRFNLELLRKGRPIDLYRDERSIKQLVQFWDVWQIWTIVPETEIVNYFGIDTNSIEALQKQLNYYPRLSEIFTRHGITPFISFNFIKNYNEAGIQQIITPVYRLNSAIEDLLFKNNCHHPFTSNSLSTIITEELYLNFLDHSLASSFNGFKQLAFMSISFQAKLNEDRYSSNEIQRILEHNFQTECLPESKNFFYDLEKQRFKNIPYVHFSFLDFGQGIVETLREQYSKTHSGIKEKNTEADILFYAFNHDSSRHPIFSGENSNDRLIPRGLFDALTIVKRYKGLLVVRSNYGKILFDFSLESDINEAFSYFGNKELYFPGTLISLYIPAINKSEDINASSIKPRVEFDRIKPRNLKYVSVNQLSDKLVKVNKELLYSTLLRELKITIKNEGSPSLVFISFRGCKLEKRLIKRMIYFLLSDYQINLRNNVVVLNSPPGNIVEEIASEILFLNSAIKNYKIHPLPIIDRHPKTDDLSIKWLGVYDDIDKEKLNNLLYEQYSLAKSDFNEPTNILGQLNTFDHHGNLISTFPNRDVILSIYNTEEVRIVEKEVENLLIKHNCIKEDNNTSLYLCNGNYYQKAYVELHNLVNDKIDCDVITKLLHSRLIAEIGDLESFNFIGVTTTSQKILKSMERQGLISSHDYFSLDNYHTFEQELNEGVINPSKKYILICDAISTGHLSKRLNAKLKELGTSIEYIGVICSILDPNFPATKSFTDSFQGKTIFLYQRLIPKYNRREVAKEILKKNIIRINPHTNVPIRLSVEETNFAESIIFQSTIEYIESTNEIKIKNRFLESINQEAIYVGYLKFNNVIHPYFFDTEQILKNMNIALLKDVFSHSKFKALESESVKIFYPRKSGVEHFNFRMLKNEVLKNQDVEVFEIERFGTPEGWRFPHNYGYFRSQINDDICLILDDGSCSGDSIIQMIDEISFYDVKEIILLCIIGRVNDHKREFFSRLAKVKIGNEKEVPIAIHFVSHWHIPTYYIDENPTIREINWLNELSGLQNIPQSIKKIVTALLKEITPKDRKKFKDYKYLPKIRLQESGQIPKKELLLIREELGKVIGYRLYKESFGFFDCFIRKYQTSKNSSETFKEIELLCATFVYEPYLYDKIIEILPDVVERIENFVSALIFENRIQIENEINSSKKIRLTYTWDKKDIVHLFFIVFKNQKLLNKLKVKENFDKLIKFTEPKESALNYVLYKLLFYFPIKSRQLNEKKFDIPIKELLAELKDGHTPSSKEIRKFYNFISTLPSRDDFESQLDKIYTNYNKQREPEFHIEKKSFDNNISRILVVIRDCTVSIDNNKAIEQSYIDEIIEKWFELLDFINPILTFSSSFKDYLTPYPYFQLINDIEEGDNSLRELVGFNESVIFSLNASFADIEKLTLLEKNIKRIQLIIKIDSTFYQLIQSRYSYLNDLFVNLRDGINKIGRHVKVIGDEHLVEEHKICIPKLYLETLLKKELLTNIKNHSLPGENSIVELEMRKNNESTLELVIRNIISDTISRNSNGEGLKCLQLLSNSKYFSFEYKEPIIDNNQFIQTLSFNL